MHRTVHGVKSAPLSQRPIMTDAEWAVFLPRMTRFAELVKAAGCSSSTTITWAR